MEGHVLVHCLGGLIGVAGVLMRSRDGVWSGIKFKVEREIDKTPPPVKLLMNN